MPKSKISAAGGAMSRATRPAKKTVKEQIAPPSGDAILDPVFAAIARHKAAFAKANLPHDDDSPQYRAALSELDEVEQALLDLSPQSMQGLRAKAEYLLTTDANSVDQAFDRFLESIVRSPVIAQPPVPIGDDPVAQIGVKISAAVAAFARIEEREYGLPDESQVKINLNKQSSHLHEYTGALQRLALATPAKSIAGALLQVAMLGDIIEDLADLMPEDASERRTDRAEEARQEGHFAIHSVLEVLEKASGVGRAMVGADYYAGADAGIGARVAAALEGKPIEIRS